MGHPVDRVKESYVRLFSRDFNTGSTNNFSWFIFRFKTFVCAWCLVLYMLHSNIDLHFKYRATHKGWDSIRLQFGLLTVCRVPSNCKLFSFVCKAITRFLCHTALLRLWNLTGRLWSFPQLKDETVKTSWNFSNISSLWLSSLNGYFNDLEKKNICL